MKKIFGIGSSKKGNEEQKAPGTGGGGGGGGGGRGGGGGGGVGGGGGPATTTESSGPSATLSATVPEHLKARLSLGGEAAKPVYNPQMGGTFQKVDQNFKANKTNAADLKAEDIEDLE